MLRPVLVTPPATTPISIEQVKAALRIDHADEDDFIESLIGAAVAHLDGWSGILGRCLVTQTWAQSFSRFASEGLRLALGPVQSDAVVITYRDGSDVEQTLAGGAYDVLTDAIGTYIRRSHGQYWPAVRRREDAVTVTYAAGYGEAADVPVAIKRAMMLMIGQWYMAREAVNIGNIVNELPNGTDALLAPFKVWRV